MSVFHSPLTQLPPIPDDLTIPQFIFDYQAPSRPVRSRHVPWFIEDHSGRKVLGDEVRQRTYDLAYALRATLQLKDGDVVCLFSVNDIDYLPAIWGVHLAGGVITPSNPGYTVDELVQQLKLSEATLIIAHPIFIRTAVAAARIAGLSEDRIVLLRKLPEVPNVVALDDLIHFATKRQSKFIPRQLRHGEGKSKLAFLSFSSGTTGKPKAVAIPHHSVIANIIQTAVHYRVTDSSLPEKLFAPEDVALGVLPLFHIYGLVYVSHAMLFCGLSLLVIPKFSFKDFLDSLVRHRVTHLFLVPPQVVLLCKASLENVDLGHVKYCVSGAAPLSGELMHNLRKILPDATIGQGYGMTETCTTVSLVPPDQRFGPIGSAGRLLPGVLARVVKPDGTLAKEGEAGELLVTGPSMALGYHKNPSATKETFIDGWVRTGDEVMIKNSEVFILDRIKEMIKVRGYQVAPAELEGHLLMRPDVADACVVSILDEYSGELPLAYIVPSPSIAARVTGDPAESRKFKEALIKYVAETKTHYKRLAGGVELIDAIPKNPSGKILRRVLREQARAARAHPKSKL
ncbi:amp dependent CoA ligase [Amanita muscaria]